MDPLFFGQLGFAESLKNLSDAIAKRFWQLVLGQLAIIVLVELLKALLRVGALSAGTAHATGVGKFREVVSSEFRLAQSLEDGLDAIAELLGKLIERELSIFVLVHHLEALARIAATLTGTSIAGTTNRRGRLLLGFVGLLEFVLSQRAVFVGIAKSDESLEEPRLLFGNFVFRQLAVTVLVELLEQGLRIGSRLLGKRGHPATQHRGECRTGKPHRTFQHVQSSTHDQGVSRHPQNSLQTTFSFVSQVSWQQQASRS